MLIKIPHDWAVKNYRNRRIYKKIGENSWERVTDIWQVNKSKEYHLDLTQEEIKMKIYYEHEKGFKLLLFIFLFSLSCVDFISLYYGTNVWAFYPEESLVILSIINSYLYYSIFLKDFSSEKFKSILKKNLKF